MDQTDGQLPSPSFVVDADRVAANIARVAAAARGAALRPHAKTHKTVALARLQTAGQGAGAAQPALSHALVFYR
jgi:D-serine deaminase-like pyridoxal phosphate-dependent protein